MKVKQMKVIPFIELYQYEYSVENITYKLHWEKNDCYDCMKNGRFTNGFMFFSDIETTHIFPDKKIHFKKGDFCYFPYGIRYQSVFTNCGSTSDKMNGIIINFQLKDKDGELFRLSEDIVYISNLINIDYKTQMLECINLLIGNRPIMAVKAKFYELLTDLSLSLSTCTSTSKYKKIMEGIKYIEINYDKKLTVKDIADYCCMSESHFRKMFSDYLKISPLKYMNNLKIRKAQNLLKSGMYSITEVAEAIGIDNPSYFSWFYKNHTGQSPRELLP